MSKVFLIVNLIVLVSIVKSENNGTFPEGFMFGVSTSAYQTEGQWQSDGKGENIWDRWIHTDPSRIRNNDTADEACDAYKYYEIDIAQTSHIQIKLYKFSISWSRILPTGTNSSINLQGLMHYQDVLKQVTLDVIHEIPMVTLYHFDLPQPLEDLGGWTNPGMVDYFVQYARVAFQSFPDVEYWITFHDPRSICRLGYGIGTHAPGVIGDGINEYLCAYTLIKAHAAVYHMYKEEFPHLKAKISMAIDIEWSEPASDSKADKEAAERRNLFEFGLYAHPIFVGNWPPVVIERVNNRSQHEHLKKSRLVQLTQEEIDHINGTADFMAVNYFTTRLVGDTAEFEYGDPGYMKDMKAEVSTDPTWNVSSSGDPIVPWGLRKALHWIKLTYDDPNIIITANGVSVDDEYYDFDRIYYITGHLSALLDAMYEDSVKVFGYTYYSLSDSFEWTEGYSQRYGLYMVNFTDNYKPRWHRESILFYEDLIDTGRIPGQTPTSSTSTSITTPSVSTTTDGGAGRLAIYPVVISTAIYVCLLLA